MNNSKFLITGATGLIGSVLVRYLMEHFPNVHFVLPVRNLAKANKMFGSVSDISICECDLLTTDFEFAGNIDYIVHCAAPTNNRFFVEHPIETYDSIVLPTQHLLEYATRHSVKGFVFLSSLEVYGSIAKNESTISEDELGFVDPDSPRSSYPLSKRFAEQLCKQYAEQHGIPVSVARLTQTTGPGVSLEDDRVINAFCRCAAKNENIILHTTGESARPYCHVEDAITAILTLLEHGVKGESYNVANESTYISAYDLAFFIKNRLNPAIDVKIELKNDTPFAPPSFLPLSTIKLCALGWKPKFGLVEICRDVFYSCPEKLD